VFIKKIFSKKKFNQIENFLKKIKKILWCFTSLDHCNHAGFFFPFPPQQTNWDFFLKFFVFLVQILLIFLISGNFSNVFNITKLKKKGKKTTAFF